MAELAITKIGFLDNFMIFMLGIGGIKRATGRPPHTGDRKKTGKMTRRRMEDDRKHYISDRKRTGRRRDGQHDRKEEDRKRNT